MHHSEAATRDAYRAKTCRKSRRRCSTACARAPARPLHHQRGGAEFHRQCAARGGLRAVHDAVGRRRSAAFVAGANALLVNLGTFDRERREATEIAVETAAQENVPWVLDPVFIDRTPPRAAFARALIARAPKAMRLNAAEFSALSGSEPTREALAAYARDTKTVVGLSGETDWVSDGERLAAIANGHALMAKVTAMGCAASALVAACLGVETDAWRATAAALMMIGVAGELAAAKAEGPGSFAVAIIDTLYNLDGPTLIARAKVN